MVLILNASTPAGAFASDGRHRLTAAGSFVCAQTPHSPSAIPAIDYRNFLSGKGGSLRPIRARSSASGISLKPCLTCYVAYVVKPVPLAGCIPVRG
ncbi:hypothetical protein [Azospirillum largimobile]